MSKPPQNAVTNHRPIAWLLWYGTWIASAIIAMGMALEGLGYGAGAALPGLDGYGLVKAGVAMFILLPIARVMVMLIIFLRERDHVYALIAMLVLAIIAAGMVVGCSSS